METRNREKLDEVLNVLQTSADRIKALETEAQEALFGPNDEDSYATKLREKTFLLMDLPEVLEPLLAGLDRELAGEIRLKMSSFARRAEPALSLASTFYMSALLYPENYQQGEKNDLEKFIEHLRSKQRESDSSK